MTRSVSTMMRVIPALAVALSGTYAQTAVDLKSQSKRVNFGGAVSTTPNKTGTAIPAQCVTGETYFKTDAPAGQNVLVCSSTDTWVVLAGGVPSTSGNESRVLTNDGNSAKWSAIDGDVAGQPAGLTVQGLRGRAVSSTAPADGEILKWRATGNTWEPAPETPWFAGSGMVAIGTTLSVDEMAIPSYQTGTGVPAGECQPGRDYYVDMTAGRFFFCREANTWAATATGETGVSSVNAASGPVVLSVDAAGTAPGWSGTTLNLPDVSGTGVTAGALSRADYDQFLAKVGASRSIQTSAPLAGGGSLATDLTLQCPTCELTTQKNAHGGYAGLTAGGLLADTQLPALAGDLSNSGGNAVVTVKGLQGRPVAATMPSDGQVMMWSAAGSQWAPQTPSEGTGGTQPATVYGSAPGLGYLIPFATSTSSSVGVSTSLVVRYVQFVLPAGAVFNTILWSVNVAAANNCGAGTDPCAVAFALYDSSGNLVLNSTAAGAAPTTTGAKSFPMAGNAMLPAGTYYFAHAANSSALTMGGATAGFTSSAFLNAGMASSTYRIFSDSSARATVSGSMITMPATIDSVRVVWAPTYTPGIALVRN